MPSTACDTTDPNTTGSSTMDPTSVRNTMDSCKTLRNTTDPNTMNPSTTGSIEYSM